MRNPLAPLAWLTLGTLACGGGAQSEQPAAAAGPIVPDASTFSSNGLTVPRPQGWSFLEPDSTMGKDTVVVLQGPFGEEALAPAVEISRRPLDATQQRRKPSHILTQLVMEIVQVFDGFEMVGSPEDIQLGGQPAAMIKMKYSESLPDGQQAARGARFYGIVHHGSIWIIRCLGAPDGSNDAEFDSIVSGLSIQS